MLGTHFFDLTRFVTDAEVVAVSGWVEAHTPPNPRGADFVDPGGSVILELSTGARALWEIGHSIVTPPRLTLHGELGTIDVDESSTEWTITSLRAPDGSTLSGPGRPAPAARPLVSHRPLDLVELGQRFLTDLVGEGTLGASGSDGRAAVETVIALHESSGRDGARVTLPLSGAARSRDVPIT